MDTTHETVYLVPHTHWDREWYEPFQRFRLRLIDLLDDVLARAEADKRFRFTLDGQLAVVDDYLEVRPEATDLLVRLTREGQLAIGPWMISLDEFCCAGETIARNLEMGLHRAEAIAGEDGPGLLRVGYLPDTFGHCAQMPQILAAAGLRQACVWRGVPNFITSHAFRWEAPDGTAVRCEYLPGSYGNGAHLLHDPLRLGDAARRHVDRMRPWYGSDPVLAMYGFDHTAPIPTLVAAVSELQDGASGVRLEICTLADYLDRYGGDSARLAVWRGELRSHARANILPGVLSCRPGLKKAFAAAERMVTRYAEPLAALWSAPPAWPDRLLDMAWQRLVASSGHDSVTGCGVDETAVQVQARIAEAEQIGRGVRDRTLAGLAAGMPAGAVVVANPSPYERAGVVRVTVEAAEDWPTVALRLPDGSLAATQEVARPGRLLYTYTQDVESWAAALLARAIPPEVHGRWLRAWRRSGEREITIDAGREPDPTIDMGARCDEVARLMVSVGGSWTVRVLDAPQRTLYASVPVPALGYLTALPIRGTGSPPAHPVEANERSLRNELVEVSVEEAGTLRLRAADGTTLTGVGRLVDGGDAGDLYNYGPPTDDLLIHDPESVEVAAAEPGPLVGAFTVKRTYRWPRGLVQDADGWTGRTAETMPVTVTTAVELRADEPFVRLTVTFVNPCRDHRLRLHVPLARPATESSAEGQFAVVTRGLTAEGGHGEEPIPTFPAYGFVHAEGVTVLLDQVSEYQLVELGEAGATELALTLLRATGAISRMRHPYRAEAAGPTIATPGAQCLGPMEVRLGLLPHAADWQRAGALGAAERFHCDLVAAIGAGALLPRAMPPVAEGLRVRGDGVVMTSLRHRAEWLELRLVALGDTATTATVESVSAARRVDLLGRPLEDLRGDALGSDDRGRLSLPMRPWEIATVQVRRR